VGHGEVHYLTEFHPSFRAGTVIALFYYPFDDGTGIRGWPQISRDLHIPPFHQFHAKVKGRPPAGLRWKAFRQVNRAAAMVGRAILLPPGSPRAALAALRKAVGELNKDAEYARDAGKTVGFVPRFQVGPAASKLLAAGTRFTPDVIAFLKHYIAKIAQNRP